MAFRFGLTIKKSGRLIIQVNCHIFVLMIMLPVPYRFDMAKTPVITSQIYKVVLNPQNIFLLIFTPTLDGWCFLREKHIISIKIV